MGFGNSQQNFGMIASKFTVAMWYTDLKRGCLLKRDFTV